MRLSESMLRLVFMQALCMCIVLLPLLTIHIRAVMDKEKQIPILVDAWITEIPAQSMFQDGSITNKTLLRIREGIFWMSSP